MLSNIMFDKNFSTTKLCCKLLDDKYLGENGKIKEEYKFKLNFDEFGIVDSKIPAKEGEKFDTFLFLPEGEGRKGEGGLRTKGCFKFSYEKVGSEWYAVSSDSKKIKKVQLPATHYPLPTTHYPLITVVTVVYNGEKYLEETIQSVINQTYPNVEYIIIDGGSTDGTLNIIKKYEDKIDYWVSENDKGIYDAMNKGINLANGEWINFMNAGDSFYDNEVLVKVFKKSFEKDVAVIYGNHKVIYPNKTRIAQAGDVKDLWKGSQFSHQSAFIKSDIHKRFKFNIKNRIGADFEFFYTISKKEYKFIKLLIVISSVSSGGVSDLNRVASLVEMWNIIDKTPKVNFYFLYRILLEEVKSILKSLMK